MAYLDSAASSLPPRSVIEAMSRYYERTHTNVHRGVYEIAEEATEAYEHARRAIGTVHRRARTRTARSSSRRTRPRRSTSSPTPGGATVAREGDVVVLTEMEHHANLVPWLQLKAERGIELRYLSVDDQFRLDLRRPRRAAGRREAAVGHRDVERRSARSLRSSASRDAAHAAGALIAIDAAQLVGHAPMDVAAARRRRRVLQRAQDARAHRDRRAVGARRAPRVDAAVPRRRRHDPRRPAGRRSAPRTRRTASRRAPRRSPRPSGSPRRSATSSRSAWTPCRPTTSSSPATRSSGSSSRFGDKVRVFSPRDLVDRGGVLSIELQGVHAHDLAQVLDRTACACGRATTARSRSCVGSACPPPRGSASVPTPSSATSTRSSTASTTRSGCSADHGRPRGPLPRDHPRPLPLAAEPGRAAESPPAHRTEGFNPLCGDEIVLTVVVDDGRSATSRSPATAARSRSPRRRSCPGR